MFLSITIKVQSIQYRNTNVQTRTKIEIFCGQCCVPLVQKRTFCITNCTLHPFSGQNTQDFDHIPFREATFTAQTRGKKGESM